MSSRTNRPKVVVTATLTSVLASTLLTGCSSAAPTRMSLRGALVSNAVIGAKCGAALDALYTSQDPTKSFPVVTEHPVHVNATNVYVCHSKISEGLVTSNRLVKVPPTLMPQFVALLGTPDSTREPNAGCTAHFGGLIPAGKLPRRGMSAVGAHTRQTRPGLIEVDSQDSVLVQTSDGHVWDAIMPQTACHWTDPDFYRLARQALSRPTDQITADATLISDLERAATSLDYYYTQAGYYPTTTGLATGNWGAASIQAAPGDHLELSTDGTSDYCISGWNAKSSFTAKHPKVFDSHFGGVQTDGSTCSQDFRTQFRVP